MPSNAPLQLAVVGSGPAGCFLAQSIRRSLPDAEITIFDRLPTPFGLVRYGVAADHQHTKAIIRQFERLFSDPKVRFAGNIEVGTDLEPSDLRDAFDAVVLASGLSRDRELGIPGAELPGVFGAGSITRVLNSHPGERPELPSFGPDVVLVGGGNVAIDVLRFLVKDREGYADSDIADHALDAYLSAPAERVTMLNRSTPEIAKSDPQMLRELAALPRARYAAPGFQDEGPVEGDRVASARIAAIAELVAPERPEHPGPEVSLRFGAVPVRIIGEQHVEAVEIRSGEHTEVVPATAVITAIGFSPAEGLLTRLLSEFSAPESAETGRIAAGFYRTGWAKRGPRGAIPENRSCAKSVAEEILQDVESGVLSAGSAEGFASLPAEIREQAISYEQWLAVDRHERELAGPGRIRRKLTDARAIIDIARSPHPTERNPQQ